MKSYLTPNGEVSQRTQYLLYVATFLVLGLAWYCEPAFLPSFTEVVSALGRLLANGLIYQLYQSLTTNIQAILLSCVVSLPLAYLTTVPAVRPFVKVLTKLRFLGLTGIVVVFTIAFGGGHALKLAILVFGMSVFLITSLYDLIEIIPKEEFDYARSLRLGPWRSLFEIVILGRLDAVLDVVRQNAAMGWVLLTMVEGLVRFEGGLGAMMLAEDKHLHLDMVFALQFVVLLIGVGQDQLLSGLRRMVCPYADLTIERRS